MDQRIEEFKLEGNNFIYFNLSEFKTNEEYREFIEAAKKYVPKYDERSLYTITNIKDVNFDTETKKIVAEWMKFNEPYVKSGAVIGIDGIRRIVVNAIFKLSGRKNMTFASNRELAIEWLLKRK